MTFRVKFQTEKHKKARDKMREWRLTPSGSRCHKSYLLRRKYGISIRDYDDLFFLQDGKCAICFRERPLVVDHDHKTKKVRGLLCDSCNNGLGRFEDASERLDRAAAYLRRL